MELVPGSIGGIGEQMPLCIIIRHVNAHTMESMPTRAPTAMPPIAPLDKSCVKKKDSIKRSFSCILNTNKI